MRFGPLIICLALTVGSVARAQIPRDDFRFRVPLEDTLTSGTLYRVLIPGPIFAGSQSFPADLRLLGENGAEWPFFIQQSDDDESLTPTPLTQLSPPTDYVPQEDIQSVFFEPQFEHQPLRFLVLNVENKEFTRPIKVFGRHSDLASWRLVANGAIHRIEGLERNKINLHNNGFRYLRLAVYNYEEPELVITDAHALAESHFVITRAASSGRAWIYFGSDTFFLPRFDLQHSLSRMELTNATPVSTGARERNPYRLTQEVWLYARLLLYVVLDVGVIFIALAWMKKFRTRSG